MKAENREPMVFLNLDADKTEKRKGSVAADEAAANSSEEFAKPRKSKRNPANGAVSPQRRNF